MLSGDRVRIHLKDPKKFGIFDEFKLTFQRLDEEDVRTKQIEGYVIRQRKITPGDFEILEISVIKKQGNRTRLIDYVLLQEEIERLELLGE